MMKTSPFILFCAALLTGSLTAIPVTESWAATDTQAATPPGKESPWPHKYVIEGNTVTFYQPQLDNLEGDRLTGRLAVSIDSNGEADKKASNKNKGKATPARYGVAWFSARIETDTLARTARLSDITLDKVNFPTAAEDSARYLEIMKSALPREALTVNLDQLEASLAISQAENKQAGAAVNNEPPHVQFSFTPALLVLVDGDPVLKATASEGVSRVINTRSLLLVKDGRWYLRFANVWMNAPALNGPWQSISQVPSGVESAMNEAVKSHLVDVMPNPGDEMKRRLAEGKYPTVYAATHPTELIEVEGEPQFLPIEGTKLMYVSNTNADVFIDANADNAWFVLLSGRWFTATSTQGPWSYVPGDKLPEDFAHIPSDSPKGAVLASIPGTPEAKESLIANAIPQTASVDRAKAKLTVSYDGGKPVFKPIESTTLSYAVNSALPVIEIKPNLYYALQNAVWFTADSPSGPWRVALSVPAEIYAIPVSSPVHYVTYVHVYGHTDSVVYVGYTSGYYGTVVSNGVVVYGGGYPCNAWVGNVWYSCPTTYGYNAAFGYDPYVGWTFGFISGMAWASAWYGPYWGPWYDDPPDWWHDGPSIAVNNVYARWGNTVAQGTRVSWSDPWSGNYGTGVRGSFHNDVTGGHGYGYAGRNVNDYTGVHSAAAGGVRYNPQTGRAVAATGGAAFNPDTGNGIAGGAKTSVNTRTGRVTDSVNRATRSDEGATAAGAFNSRGPGGDAHGSGYVHYNADTGEVTHGGVVHTDGGIYAGKDGNVYRYNRDNGWQQMQSDGQFKSVTPPSGSGIHQDQLARSRGDQRTQVRNNFQTMRQNSANTTAGAAPRGQIHRDIGSRPAVSGTAPRLSGNGERLQNLHGFDRSNYGQGFHGHMGGFRHFR
ncbi:hypothetical protein SOASR030_04110 [Leminorella grimontii]|uniref:Carbohydrate-binding family V/XII n=1 Tax=Leminorella grimontii TaxID=82981 RepID=A0AAV5MZT1_9GAMM|nr:hypothetical protein [Leminorella grimontii]KFC96503.1 hypothetical protein GLGR_1679 [Leminorella grimontii ATCC 33999 = DSM 5078]GKX54299.1 hypothetical protein SOASR030_04110 [Leminorella grimontii]